MTLQDQAKIAEMMCRNLLDQAIGAGIVHLNDDDMADAQELTDNNVYHMANLLRTYLGDVERLRAENERLRAIIALASPFIGAVRAEQRDQP